MRIGVVAGLAAMLTWYLFTGKLYLYIHERSIYLVAMCVPILLAMVFADLHPRPDKPTAVGGLVLLAIPLLIGVMVPSRPLGAAALDTQLPTVDSPTAWETDQSLQLASGSLVLDLRQMANLQTTDPRMGGLEGQRASLLGFVYHKAGLPDDQFLVGRFMVRCCTADAVAVSVPVQYEGADDLKSDSWVQVDGTVHYSGSASAPEAVVRADQVRIVAQPDRPYLYP